MAMMTTLKRLRNPHYEEKACKERWIVLLKNLKKKKADDAPLSIRKILELNGLDDAIWALRAVDGHDREKRLFAIWCARRVLPMLNNARSSIDALRVAERLAEGEFTYAGMLDAARAVGIPQRLHDSYVLPWSAVKATLWISPNQAVWVSYGETRRSIAEAASRIALRAAGLDEHYVTPGILVDPGTTAWRAAFEQETITIAKELLRMLDITATDARYEIGEYVPNA